MYQNFIKPFWLDVKNFTLDTLFPKSCLNCGTEGSFLCLPCKAGLKPLEHQRCIACQKSTPFGLTHPGCQTPYGADGLISFYDYHDEKVAQILIKGKYSFLPEVYEILGKLLVKKLQSDFPHLLNPEPFTLTPILVPIPLHTFRKRWRGFNQAEILCQSISVGLGLETVNALTRKKSTKTQKDLKREARLKNVSGAFAISENLKSSILNHICLLVDDVTTTGATLQEASKILKKSGANKVICLTVARD